MKQEKLTKNEFDYRIILIAAIVTVIVSITILIVILASNVHAAIITTPSITTPKTPIDLIGCRDIEESGVYKITGDLSFGSDDEDYCIDIYANDVILDGQGHSIKCRPNHQGDCSYAIGNGINMKNITIKNLIIYNIGEGTAIDLSSLDIFSISNIQVSNVSEGIAIANVSNGILTDFYAYNPSRENGESSAIFAAKTRNVIIFNNILQGYNVSIVVGSNNNTLIYNNYFLSTDKDIKFLDGLNKTGLKFNIPKTPGTNRIGGPYLGGNYWAKPNGRGFSQTCSDNNRDGLCDACYSLGYGFYDMYPLTSHGPGPIQNQCNIASV